MKLSLPTENLEKFCPLDFRLGAVDLSFPLSVCVFFLRSLPRAARAPSVVVLISGSEDDEVSESEFELESDSQVAVFKTVGTWAVCPLLNPCRDCRGAGTGFSVRFFRVRTLGRDLDLDAGDEDSKGRESIAPGETPPTKDGVRAGEEALWACSRTGSLKDLVRLKGSAKSIAWCGETRFAPFASLTPFSMLSKRDGCVHMLRSSSVDRIKAVSSQFRKVDSTVVSCHSDIEEGECGIEHSPTDMLRDEVSQGRGRDWDWGNKS